MNAVAAPVVNEAFLKRVVDRMLAVGSPLKIVLFGSHARGTPHPDSDLDLFVVEEHSDLPRHKRATRYRLALQGLHPSKDIVVYTPQEVAEWATVDLAFPTTVLREGKVLYERPR